MSKIEIGTISHGTLRTVDLLDAFAHEIERIDGAPSPLTEKAFVHVRELNNGAEETEADHSILSELFDRLDNAAPDGMYFGTLEGDGSDFGFWSIDDAWNI